MGEEVATGTTLGEQWALCYRYTFLHLPRVPPVLVTVRLFFNVSLLTTGWLLRRLFLVVAREAGVVYGGSYTRSLSTIALVAEKVVLGGGKGGRGCVRGIVHQVALNHCFRCLALEHLSLKICMATVHLVAPGWTATFEEAVAR